jgi:acid phosphatase
VGTITGTGETVTYAAPATAGSHTVTATSVADTTKSASAAVTVTAVSVSISPSKSSILTNAAQQFTAIVKGTSNTGPAWTVDGVLNGNSSVGAITGTGETVTYTAPSTAGSHTVTATSLADTSKFASAAITVTTPLPVSISISPTTASILPNATQPFAANVQNTSNTGVTWTVDSILGGNSTVGTITGTATTVTYTAPATAASHAVTVTSLADTTQSASAAVNVTLTPQTFPSSSHVFVVIEENQSFSQVFPSGSATDCSSAGMPYLCGLAAANGLALNFYANVHGSLLDYLYATSGSTWSGSPYDCNGSGCASTGVITGDNIVRALTAAGLTWRGYFEDMPSEGYMGGDTANYLLHHNPFPWYSDVANSVTQQNNMYPFTQFVQDAQANTLQNFSLIIPNGIHDADEPFTTSPSVLLATADTWLNTNISPLLSTPPFQAGGDGILMIVFDEADEAGESGDPTSDGSCSPTQSTGCGGHVAFVMIGPNVTPASTTANTYHFQDMLHTIIHLLGATDYMNGASAGADIALLPGVN